MRPRWVLLAMLLTVAVSAAAQPIGEPGTVGLFADWPEDVEDAMEQPIPLTPLFPHGQADLHDGPLLPGSSTAGTVPSFTYTLVNPDGTQGPAGDLRLDPSEPMRLTVYLSPDQLGSPSEEEAPVDPSVGAAPEVTVDATLRMGGDLISETAKTQTLVSANPPVEEPVTMYTLELPFDRETLQAGQGLQATFSVHQLDHEETLTQPRINIHTGEAYPTGLSVPIEHREEPLDKGGPLDLNSIRDDPETVQNIATIALVGSLALAAMAGTRLVKQLR